MKHPINSFFVIDIETLNGNTTPLNCGMFELACLYVERDSNGDWPTFGSRLNHEHVQSLQWNGGVDKNHVNYDTLMFHERIRGVELMREVMSREVTTDWNALAVNLMEFIQYNKKEHTWIVARRPQFDIPRIELLLEPYGFRWPLPYTKVQDLATLDQAVPGDTYPDKTELEPFTSHYAIDDCFIEAMHYIKLVDYLTKVNEGIEGIGREV